MAVTLTTSYQMLGQKKLGTNYGSLYVRIYAKCNSQSIEDNTSSVTYQSRLYYDGGGGSTYIIAQGSTKVVTSGTGATTTTTGWKNFEGGKTGYYYTGETVVKTITGTVSHDINGDASVTASAAFSSAGSWGWSGTASGTATLENIPRASTITATRAYIGEVSQLTVYRGIDTYTHTIAYTFGNLSGYILANGTTSQTATKLSATSIGFTIPTTWYNQIPNTQSGVCTLTITTYNGDTQIGTANTTTFYADVNPSNSMPTITASAYDGNGAATALTGSNQTYIKYFSTPNVSWSVTAKNGASVSGVRINDVDVTTSPYQFLLNDIAINVYAWDSRGITASKAINGSFVNYAYPTFSVDGSRPSPTSLNASVVFSGTWWNGNFGAANNTMTVAWRYKKTTDTTWITGGTLVSGTDYSISNNTFKSGTSSTPAEIQIGGALGYEYSWDISIDITDRISTFSRTITIPKGIPIVNWDAEAWYFNVDANSEIYAPYNFSSLSVTKIENYLAGTGTLTPEEQALYDVNDNGSVDATDLAIIKGFVKYNVTTANPAKITIPNNKNVSVPELILKDGNNTEVTKIGFDKISGTDITSQGTYELSGDGLTLTDSNSKSITLNTSWLPEQVLQTNWFNTSGTTITNGMKHMFLLIVARPKSTAYRSTFIMPTTAIPSSNKIYQITDEANYISFNLRYSGDDIIITAANRSSDGYVDGGWLYF